MTLLIPNYKAISNTFSFIIIFIRLFRRFSVILQLQKFARKTKRADCTHVL